MGRRRFGRLGLPLFLLLALFPCRLCFARVDHVILAVIDGLRNQEGFGDPDCQPGYRGPLGDGVCLVPELASLAALGTLYTGEPMLPSIPAARLGSAFVNDFAAWTTPANTMLLTGARDLEPNRMMAGGTFDLRPAKPTLFEVLRKELGWSREQVYAVVSKPNVYQVDRSSDPLYGEGASLIALAPSPGEDGVNAEDVDVATVGRCLLQGRPIPGTPTACTTRAADPERAQDLRFVFLHFGGVDHDGHEDWDEYLRAVGQVGEQIETKIWGELCSEPTEAACARTGQNPNFRRNNTVLLVTTDHGRESFTQQKGDSTVLYHGGLDYANRNIFLLAVGPKIEAGREIVNASGGFAPGCRERGGAVTPCRRQEDVAPTVAAMFGASMPDAEGVKMDELLGHASGPFPFQRSEPRIAASAGKLHVVWSERNPATGDRVICYEKVDPAGKTDFSVPANPALSCPRVVSSATDAERVALTANAPFLFVNSGIGYDDVHVGYLVTKSLRAPGDNLADVYLASSENGGRSWLPPFRVAQGVVETAQSPIPTAYFSQTTGVEIGPPRRQRLWVFAASAPGTLLGRLREDGAWEAPVTISDVPKSCLGLESVDLMPEDCLQPSFFAQKLDAAEGEGGTAELVWQAIGGAYGWDVFQASEGSPAWSVSRVDSTPARDSGWQPTVAYDGATLNVAWSGTKDGEWKVWGNHARFPLSGARATQPDLAQKDATNLFAAYSMLAPDPRDPQRRQYDVFWSWSRRAGADWWPIGRALLPDATSAPSMTPAAAYDARGGKPWIVWREGSSPNWTIRGRSFEP